MNITIEELNEYKQKIEDETEILLYDKIRKLVETGYTPYGIMWHMTRWSMVTGKKRDALHPIMENEGEIGKYLIGSSEPIQVIEGTKGE